MLPEISFRARILFIVLGAAVIPLGLLGLWLTYATVRSGEDLVRSRLNDSMDNTVSLVISNWIRQRSALLFLSEDRNVQHALREGAAEGPPDAFLELFENLDPSIASATVFDLAGKEAWRVERTPPRSGIGLEGAEFVLLFSVPLEIRDRLDGNHLGKLEVEMSIQALLPSGVYVPALAGQVLGVFEIATGAALLPLPFEPWVMEGDEFRWGGDRWLTTQRGLSEPPVRLVAAAPLTPFIEPFETAARRGSLLLLVVAAVGLVLATLLSNRLTRSLQRLSSAAEAVTRGELNQRVEPGGMDEIGRVARAFNQMTESLEETLGRLATRESLAAVGQFAASLAHEVRNPLTAIRVDMQLVEEGLAEGSAIREAQERALREIVRLDETVSRALKVARSGELELEVLDLREPIRAAAEASIHHLRERQARLSVSLGPDCLPVSADGGALEQLFLNLLQNSAHAVDAGGVVSVEAKTQDDAAEVAIRDDGTGIPADILGRVFEPLFSTRPEGTGLGLAVARRIAVAHGGELHLESNPGEGTTAVVRLPLASNRENRAT